MRFPIAPEGWRIIFIATVVLAGAAWLLSWITPWLAWPILPIWLWVISFFRDPERPLNHRTDRLYSPADGTITAIDRLPHDQAVGGAALRIRIFLSIFNVHINRMPTAVQVQAVQHQPGQYLNALRAESSDQNEAMRLELQPQHPWTGPIILRQIAGAIARTIVCHAQPGQSYASGQRFGMIKFGSGTELLIPDQPGLTVLVHVGQKVRGGLTEFVCLEKSL
ncbi:MAG: Phosphatidylserine decarboxylase proenzyme [Phycisphaerae bacterium]|nr:Phosphatidylserine decarboxylase proenzyme [Phycisphaerae bacterium]